MAEIAVGLVKDKLMPLLTEEAYLLKGIHQEVEKIQCDLNYILDFLRDADARVQTNETTNGVQVLKLWVKELRKAAFKVEDVIDEYVQLMVQQQCSHRHRFIGFLYRSACLVIKLKTRHNIASKIQDIRQTIRDINQRSADNGFIYLLQQGSTSDQSNTWYDPRKNFCFLKETEVVGIESTRDELIGKLEGGSHRRTMISVVGMGGLGKTTLAHQVYVHTKESFDCHAWIEVSQSYKKVELLQKLMKKFYEARNEHVPEGIDGMDETTVMTKLREYLQGKKYLVIFDDVWKIDFWGDIEKVLPENNEKIGRIMITTRDVEVAKFCKTSSIVHIHHLQPLPLEKARELFCSKAFHEFEGHCPTHFDKLSHEIVERCQGLPLAIVAIAGLLSTKSNIVDEWRKLINSLSSELESNKHLTSISKILSLSYNDLPYYLKCCFLYFGIFPEDCSIRCGRLIRQWIAEGFVISKKDKTSEIVAEEYLIELINRNLVQVSEVDFDGKAKTCRIHDLLREIILNKIEDLSFCQVLSRNDSSVKGLTRRLSIVNGSPSVVTRNTPEICHVRSVFIIDNNDMPNKMVSALTTNFKLLKVLDFEDAPNLDHLPKDIGSLFHLKYLSVRGTRVGSLPKSIGKLQNLETLDLKQSLVPVLPVEIKRLHKLRHLFAYHSDWNKDYHINRQKGVKADRGIGQLQSLQKLYFIEVDIVGFDIFEELSKLTELRKLGIKKLRSADGRALCDCIQRMKYLESLDVTSTSEDDMIEFEESMASPPQFLRRLYLKGVLRKLPEWIVRLENLVRLDIAYSKLQNDPLKALKNLPNLLELGISYDAYYGEKLRFEEGAFTKLKVLSLSSLSKLRLLVIEEGALCGLEVFEIGPSLQLKELSSGFQHVRNLKQVHFWEMQTDFMMLQNFQSLQSTTANIRFNYVIDGKLWGYRLEDVITVLEIMRGELDPPE
ncbi:NB-ARC domain, LRR domain containing protein [Parasponia andersonii]|uniref:NB-ARC domain, LRR domain containing protein n=1 Tax=Parasponia andersonii TaxID=3476 RepID=A0A2P5AQE4_PARAD|nr:NB-ARC domain, LRR domain containing protein [Parasponia andersonii]